MEETESKDCQQQDENKTTLTEDEKKTTMTQQLVEQTDLKEVKPTNSINKTELRDTENFDEEKPGFSVKGTLK